MTEREREVEHIVEEELKVKIPGRSERRFIVGAVEGERALLEGSHASPASPSNNSRVQVKT